MTKLFYVPKFTENLIPASTRIPVTYLMTQYFHAKCPINALLVKLPSTYTRGFLSM